MEESGQNGVAVSGRVELAHEAPFQLGTLAVHPSTRQLFGSGTAHTLEPRVMQVLVALARANEAVVTRDELSAWCWDGRIVSEDAINRTLVLIRRVATGIGGGSFHVDTISKVGYRLIVAGKDLVHLAAPDKASRPAPIASPDRRKWIAGAALLGVAGLAGNAWWQRTPAYRPDAEALEYYRRGLAARSLGLVESTEQATSYFRQAVRADPKFADAWGALARQNVDALYAEGDDALNHNLAEVRSAAHRALLLEPDQAEAQGALAVIQPYFRRWRAYEAAVARVADAHRGLPQVTVGLGTFYSNVARWEKSIACYREVRENDPMRPGPTGALAIAYWAAGRIEEAESESARALERWPRFHGMWFSRMILLTYSGKPEQAVAFAGHQDFYPRGAGAESVVELRLATARALVSRSAVELESVGTALLKSVVDEVLNVPQAARFFGAVEDRDTLFDLLQAYFYRRGRFAQNAPTNIHPFSRITTDFLFHPTARILWGEPRFATLTRDIGLDKYWREVGFVPPHRRH